MLWNRFAFTLRKLLKIWQDQNQINKKFVTNIMIAPNKDKMFIDSLVARMMSIDDLIQITELKAQQMIQE